MSVRGYSLVEVVMAAAIVAIGVAAGAVLANSLVIQQEMSTSEVRAANLQEQAVMLYRLGITGTQDMYNILPESCSASATPAANTFSLTFGSPVTTVYSAGGSPVACEVVSCAVTYANPIAGTSDVAYASNTLQFVRPTIRVGP